MTTTSSPLVNRRSRRLVVGVLTTGLVASLLSVLPAVTPPMSGFVVTADAAGCLDDAGNPVTCPISVDPLPLPVGATIGEYELGLLSPVGDIALAQVREYALSGAVGGCDPQQGEVCELSTQIRNGPLRTDARGDVRATLVTAPGLASAAGGGRAVASTDFDGDGRQDLVAATTCPGDTVTSNQVCLSVFDSGANRWTNDAASSPPLWRSGLPVLAGGRLRLAAGLLLRTTAEVNGATFSLNPQGGVLMTLTTQAAHGFRPGQPVRFAENGDLAEAMCPSLSAGSVLCGNGLSAAWLPVESVPSRTQFTVRIGNVVDAGGTEGDGSAEAGPVVPAPWPARPQVGSVRLYQTSTATTLEVTEAGQATIPALPFPILVGDETSGYERMVVTRRTVSAEAGNAVTYRVTRTQAPRAHIPGEAVQLGCQSCDLAVSGVRPGLALVVVGPGGGTTLHVLSVSPGARRQFALVDSERVGKVSTRQAVDVAADDFDGDGQDELAVAWGDSSGVGLTRMYGISESKQLLGLTTATAFNSLSGEVGTVSIASGKFVTLQGSNVGGADLAVAWSAVPTAQHLMRVFDVTSSLALRPAAINGRLPDGQRLVGAWKPGTDYSVGDVVSDATGFWRATVAGRSRCTTDVSEETTFYFPDPTTNRATWIDRIPATQVGASFVPTWPAQPSTVPSGVVAWTPALVQRYLARRGADPGYTTIAPDGPALGYLDPSPAPVGGSPMVVRGVQPTAPGSIMLGQYVSAPLSAQTIDARFLATMAAAEETSTASVATQLRIRVVSNDGTRTRGYLFGGSVADLAALNKLTAFSTVRKPTNSTSVQDDVRRARVRSLPTSETLGTLPLRPVKALTGDRLVVEIGVRSGVQGATGSLWVGSVGQSTLPAEGAVPEWNLPDGATEFGDPSIRFTQPIALDNCATHWSDEGVRGWERVTPPEVADTWSPANPSADLIAAAARSTVRIAAADIDMNGIDEIAVAETRPTGTATTSSPIRVQVWSLSSDCASPSTPAQALACTRPGAPARRMVLVRQVDTSLGDTARATGPQGGGGLALAVGRTGAPKAADASFPNGVNPNITVAWTCDGDATCGRSATNTSSGSAIQALDVCIPGTDADRNGIDDVCSSSAAWTVATGGATFVAGAAGTPGAWLNRVPEIVALDADRDSKTLGSPLEYLETGYLTPLMVLRAPPVHFDAVDADGDGTISPDETWDVNNCFSDYLATGDSYTCETTSSFGSTTTVTSTIQASVHTSAAYTWAGGVTGVFGGGFNTGGCDGGGGEPVRVTDTDGESGLCVEGSVFLELGSDTRQSAETARTVGQSFTYASRVTASAGADLVYAGLQQNQVLEYPIYAGTGWGLGAGDPVQYLTQRTPLQTRFRWLSADELGAPSTGQGLVPQNVLSYAASELQLSAQTPSLDVTSAALDRGALKVRTKGNHNLTCVDSGTNLVEGVTSQPLTIGVGDLYSTTRRKDLNLAGKLTYPCALSGQRVQLADTRTVLDRGYVAVQANAADELLLQPVTPLGDLSDSTLASASSGRLVPQPGSFPVDEWSVGRFRALNAEATTNRESGYDQSVGWGIGSQLGVGFRVVAGGIARGFVTAGAAVYGGIGVNVNYSQEYSQDQLQTMSIGTTQETSFGVKVTGDIDPGISYSIKPYVVQAPSGAMVLDWTTGVDATSQFWSDTYAQSPDPGFALPDLLTPYKSPSPNSNPRVTVPALLRSPDFGAWECSSSSTGVAGVTVSGECKPAAKAPAGKPLLLVARVHNYALKAYDGSRPITVRFFVGDPARGGYQVAQADALSQRSAACVLAFCLPARGETLAVAPWDWSKTFPALAGQGSPVRPLPMYAVIDPTDAIDEVKDLVVPVDVAACRTSYPTWDGAGGLEDFESACPTTNNEGYWAQEFDRVTGASLASSTDLRVSSQGVKVLSDGSISVSVTATRTTGRVQVRLFECASAAASCSPATNAKARGTRVIPAIAAGGAASTRFLLSGKGVRSLYVQVVALDNWEEPGGGPLDRRGLLTNNVVRVSVTQI